MGSSLVHTVGLVLALALLEAVLCADNAAAIAALVNDLACPSLRQQALNRGLLAAFALRFAAILLATWVVPWASPCCGFWPLGWWCGWKPG